MELKNSGVHLPKTIHKKELLSDSSLQGKIYLDSEMKIIEQTIIKEPNHGFERSLTAECIILKKLKGVPNIAQLKDREECRNKNVEIDYYDSGNLFDYISRNLQNTTKLILELQFKNVFKKLIDALSECHSRNIFHFDIKPENIFLKGEGSNMEPYLGDFGFAIDTSDTITPDNIQSIKFRGSPIYYPPEKLLQMINLNETSPKEIINYVASKIDIYGLGNVFVTCIIKGSLISPDDIDYRLPLPSMQEKLYNLLDVMLPMHLQGTSPELTELLIGMLNKNPQERWSLIKIKASSWYNDKKGPSDFSSVVENPIDPKYYTKPIDSASGAAVAPIAADEAAVAPIAADENPFTTINGKIWYYMTNPNDKSKPITYAYSTLDFTPYRDGFNIRGTGDSFWSGQIIHFNIVGTFVNGSIEIFKTNQGNYTNTTIYRGQKSITDILTGKFELDLPTKLGTVEFSLKMPKAMDSISDFPQAMKNLNRDFVGEKKYLSYKNINSSNYESKYLKYKQKYLNLKNLIE